MTVEQHSRWAQARVTRILAARPARQVIGVMVMSLDGVVAVGGRSASLSSDPDRALVGAWREAADALLVGPATLAAEVYGGGLFAAGARARRVARGVAPTAPIITIDRSGTLDLDRATRAREPLALTVYVPRGHARADARATWIELDDISAAAVIVDIRKRLGHQLVIAEPGPRLLEALLSDRALSALSLTVSPSFVRFDQDRPDAASTDTETPPYALLEAGTSVYLKEFDAVDVEVRDHTIFAHLAAARTDAGSADAAPQQT